MRSISGKFFCVSSSFGNEIGEILSLGKTSVLIRWWLTKEYFRRLECSPEVLDKISEGELIKCSVPYEEWVPFTSLLGKIWILSEKEYFCRESTKDNEFFFRNSEYNPTTAEFKVSGTVRCYDCKKTINPDVPYVADDDDIKLFHMNCRHGNV